MEMKIVKGTVGELLSQTRVAVGGTYQRKISFKCLPHQIVQSPLE